MRAAYLLPLPLLTLAACNPDSARAKSGEPSPSAAIHELEERVDKLEHKVEKLEEGGAPAAAHDPPAGDHGAAADAHGDKPGKPGKHGKDAHAAPHWGYEGELGPARWAELSPAFEVCAKGKEQSPIDIVPPATSPDVAPIRFTYLPSAGELVDNGHTLQMNLQPGSFATVDGRVYQLVQFHIHTPSEHTVGGEALPMEVHLVHKDQSGKLAVVGVRFAAGEASRAMAPVWAAMPDPGGKAKVARFDPATLLPRDRSAYRYDGSLTTPPCSEHVEWIVLRRTTTESSAIMDAFKKRFGANARPVQPANDRVIE